MTGRKRVVPPVPSGDLIPQRCGECWFCDPITVDSGACHVNPPYPVWNEGEFGFARPQVDLNDRGCRFFNARHKA
jgi:hypothetical protein